jgi:2-methylcitrate dehydratase PrpD
MRPDWNEQHISGIVVRANPMCGKVCNIREPGTGTEIGYSIRMLVAMALRGMDTGRPDSLDPALLADPALIALRDRVSVVFDPDLTETAAVVNATMQDGEDVSASADVGLPGDRPRAQAERLRQKFQTLVAPLLGADRTGQLMRHILALDRLASVAPIADLLRPPAGR